MSTAEIESSGRSPIPYTILRGSNFYHRMHYLGHSLGIQSNVLVSARYTASGKFGRLTREAVFSALRTVVEECPDLAVVGVIQPHGNRGRHRLHQALLHEVDLDACVEFRDNVDGVQADIIEAIHNEWHWMEPEPTTPWWRVYVLGGRDIVFTFHHLVCDGRFGLEFHRRFLAALNASPSLRATRKGRVVRFDPDTVTVTPDTGTVINNKPSIVSAVLSFLYWTFLRILFGSRLFFSDAPRPKSVPSDPTTIARPEDRAVTRVTSYRVHAPQMADIIAACRANGTTFTALLITMLKFTLATDWYPNAMLGSSWHALDIRPLLPRSESPLQGPNMLTYGAGGQAIVHFLGRFRRALRRQEGGKPTIDAAAIWEMARECRTRIAAGMTGNPPTALTQWLAGNLHSPDLEAMTQQGIQTLALFMNNGFSVSNLGAFSTEAENVTEKALVTARDAAQELGHPWKIEDVQFSAGVMDGRMGWHGLVFNVVGLKGGDTVINAEHEEGVVERDMPGKLMETVFRRIEAIL